MNRLPTTLVFCAFMPAMTFAQSTRSYPCTQGNLARRVDVVYLGSGDVPCEVRYYKEGQEPEVLWRASVESGYCEAQARDFVSKLQGFGWVCSDAGSAPAARGPGADDTADLAAGR